MQGRDNKDRFCSRSGQALFDPSEPEPAHITVKPVAILVAISAATRQNRQDENIGSALNFLGGFALVSVENSVL